MRSRGSTILLAMLVLLQSVLGHMGTGPIAFCLGGGHEHGAEEVESSCMMGCDHEGVAGAPMPPADDHDCDCTDVEFSVLGFLEALSKSDDSMATAPMPQVLHLTSDTFRVESSRGPPPAIEDPGGDVIRVMLECTRLLL